MFVTITDTTTTETSIYLEFSTELATTTSTESTAAVIKTSTSDMVTHVQIKKTRDLTYITTTTIFEGKFATDDILGIVS